jgi:hypothetical protein
MLEKQWMKAAAVLIGMTALIACQSLTTYGETPSLLKAKGIVEDFVETDDGEQVLTLNLSDDTSLELYLISTTEVWTGDTLASTDLLEEAWDMEVEVEYGVEGDRNVLHKLWLLSDVEE